MNVAQKIVKNSGLLFVSQIVTMFSLMVLFVLVGRLLGDVEFGKLSFAQAVTTIIVIFADLGLSNLSIREVSRKKELASKYIDNIFILKILLSLLTFVMLYLIINLMGYPEDTRIVTYLFAVFVIVRSFTDFLKSTFRAFEIMEYETIVNITGSLILIISGAAILYMGYGLVELLYTFIFSEFVKFVMASFIIFHKFAKPSLKVDMDFCKSMIIIALPFGFTSVIGMVYMRIDIVMLSMMKGDAVCGWYSAAATLFSALIMLPNTLSYAVFPAMSRFFEKSKNSFVMATEKFAKYLFILSLPFTFVLIFLAEDIVYVLYGNGYENTVYIIQILAFYLPFRFVNNSFGLSLSSVNKEGLRATSATFAALCNVVLNFLLIPEYSYIGAAVATVLTEFVLLYSYYYFNSKFSYRYSLTDMFKKTGLAGFICLSLGYVFVSHFALNPFILTIVILFVYVILIWVFKIFDREDIKIFEDAVGRSMLKEVIND